MILDGLNLKKYIHKKKIISKEFDKEDYVVCISAVGEI